MYFSGIAVLRISGTGALNVLQKISGRKEAPMERKATLCQIKCPETRDILDSQAIFLYFKAPRSFTGIYISSFFRFWSVLGTE